MGQQLVSKITERDQGTKELNQIVSPSERELLFDYAIFGQGFGFGIHYTVPVRDIKTGNIEGCIIYQVNKTSSENFDLKGKVDAPLFIDVEKYKELPISQAGCSVFFRKWNEQGLEVATELYTPNKCFSRTVSENKQEVQAYSLSQTSYFATIPYWLDLGGYIPAGATAYAIGLNERKKIFRRNSDALEVFSTLESIEIDSISPTKTKIDIINHDCQIISGYKLGVSHMSLIVPIFQTFEPTTIEEYQVLYNIGKYLKVDMPKVIYPENLSDRQIYESFCNGQEYLINSKYHQHLVGNEK